MTRWNTFSITTIGLGKVEQETLECLFRLSGRHALVDFWSAAAHAAIMVNIDDPAAIQLWQAYRINNPKVPTIIVAEKYGRYTEYPYLPKRFLKRPCFAKQVLSLVERVCAASKAHPDIDLSPTEGLKIELHHSLLAIETYVRDKLQLIADVVIKPEPLRNPYYN